MSLQLDTLAYTNRLQKLPPEHKLVFALLVLIIALCTHPPVQLLIAVWMSIWTVVYARIPLGIYLRIVYLAILFLITSLPALIINGVSLTDLALIKTDIWRGMNISNYYLYISYSGIHSSFTILTRSLATISCLYFVMLTVPFVEILAVMRRLGFPAILTELLLLMYRFIFILLTAASELWTAQQSRIGYRTWRISMHSLSLLVGQLFRRTIEQYHQFSLGLAARGFNGEIRVVNSRHYQTSKRYAAEALLGCAVLIFFSFY